MSLSVSSALSTASVAAANSSSIAATAPRTPQPQVTANPGYTVQLSQAQQVYQRYNQGQQISQIAQALNLTESAVNNYLGITSSGS